MQNAKLRSGSIRNPRRNSSFRIPHSAFRNYQRGFTLLELLVAIFVVSLLLATALPSFMGMSEGSLRSDAKRLASVLRYLNDTSVSTKETLHIKLFFRDKSIHYGSPEGEKTEKFESIAGLDLPSRGMISDGEVIIFFGPTGATESFVFHLRAGKESMTVSLNALSGRVRIIQNEEQES